MNVTDTCGNCGDGLNDGHDLNELANENLPDALRFRCCDCYADLTGETCGALPDTIPDNLDRLLALANLLARENHPLAVELHAAYVDLREATGTLLEKGENR